MTRNNVCGYSEPGYYAKRKRECIKLTLEAWAEALQELHTDGAAAAGAKLAIARRWASAVTFWEAQQ